MEVTSDKTSGIEKQGHRSPPKLRDSTSSEEDDNRVGPTLISPDSRKNDSTDDDDDTIDRFLSEQMKTSLMLSEKILSQTSMDGIVEYIKKRPNLKIITMVGAGISTDAGIPDFRTPGSGIYDNLQKYNLPYPSAIFELNFFKRNPEPFFQFVQNMFPSETYLPTKAHYFIKLLQDKNLLLRHYTQNIDSLDRSAGIYDNNLIEAHGTFYKSHCLKCQAEYDYEWLKCEIKRNVILTCTECDGIVKPDIVFFGEALPRKFYDNVTSDFKMCDLLIIMGSSLAVEPFASLVTRVRKTCPRLMINATQAGANLGLKFSDKKNGRDVLWLGDCDEGCQLLATKLGWQEELKELVDSSRRSRAEKLND